MTIDRDSYEPRYKQLARIIRATVERGDLAPGAMVPSEATLMQEHDVARETVRKAMALLRNQGVIVTEPGRGSYVRLVGDIDVVYVDYEVQVKTRMPSSHEQKSLGLPEGTPVLVMSRPGSDEDEEVLPGDRTVIEFRP